MVWKEPGKDKDPWKSTERPPDLERIVKNLHKRLGWLFGGKRGGQQRFHLTSLWWLLPAMIVAWLVSGFYKVAPNDRGANFVFGRFTQAVSPGLHWHAPWPIGHADIIYGVDGQDYTRSYNRLLTRDGNVVVVDAVLRYHVVDLKDYLFNTATVGASTESADVGAKTLLGKLLDAAIRAAVIQNTLGDILASGRDAVEADAGKRLDGLLKSYDMGIAVTQLTFKRVSLPESVSTTDADVSAAQQDAEHAKAEAQAYANDLLPDVKSAADAKVAEAEIYRTTLVNQAQADTARFDAVLAAYRKAPALTRDTLYIQNMEEILANASKVVVDTRDGNVSVQLTEASQPEKPHAPHGTKTEKMPDNGTRNSANTAKSATTPAPAADTHKGRQ
jgi:modulator of FtsH protease HflK